MVSLVKYLKYKNRLTKSYNNKVKAENKMLETNILINSCQVAVKHDTFEKFTELMNSLPKKPSEAAIFYKIIP